MALKTCGPSSAPKVSGQATKRANDTNDWVAEISDGSSKGAGGPRPPNGKISYDKQLSLETSCMQGRNFNKLWIIR